MHKARTVEEHVDAPGLLHKSGNGGFVEHIEPGGADVGHTVKGLEQFCVDVGGPDLCAFLGHGQCGGAADALACGRDEGVFSSKSHVLS